MSDIETRLTEYAERWRASQPPAPSPRLQTRPAWFNWAAVTATAAVVAGLVVGITLTVPDTHQVAHPTTPPWLSFDVPWIDKAAPPPIQSSSGTTYPQCGASDVSVALAFRELGMLHDDYFVSFTNKGQSPCVLSGKPQAHAVLASGGSLAIPVGNDGSLLTAAVPLAPKEASYLVVEYVSCTTQNPVPSGVSATRLTVSLSGGGRTLDLPVTPIGAMCGHSLHLSVAGFGQLVVSNATPCSPSDLRITPDYGNGAGGTLIFYYSFTNKSASPCVLSGVPSLVAHLSNGTSAPARNTSATNLLELRPPQVLASGESAAAVITWATSVCAGPNAPSVTGLTLTLPSGGSLGLPISRPPTPGCYFGITRFGMPPLSEPPPVDPYAGLTATLTLPPTVKGDQVLHFVVTLTATSRDVHLAPCPGYLESTEGVKESLSLNCGTVTTIRVGHPLRYEMRMQLPSLAPGPTAVVWTLAVPDSPVATGTVVVRR